MAGGESESAGWLNNLSVDLAGIGDRAGALEAIRARRWRSESGDRRLARGSNPARYEPELATSLNNLSNRLSESGDRAGALEAIREAVTLLEPYAAEYPKGTPARWLEVCKGTQRRLERSD